MPAPHREWKGFQVVPLPKEVKILTAEKVDAENLRRGIHTPCSPPPSLEWLSLERFWGSFFE